MSGRGNVLVEKCPVGEMSVREVSVGEVSVQKLSSGECQSGNCPVGKLFTYQKNYHYRNILILQCAIISDIEKYIAPTFEDSTVEGNTRGRVNLRRTSQRTKSTKLARTIQIKCMKERRKQISSCLYIFI